MEERDNRCGEGVVGWGGLAIQERLIKDTMTQRKKHKENESNVL